MTPLRTLITSLLLVFSTPLLASQAETALQILDYIAVDYPEAVRDGKVIHEGEYAEQLEFAGRVGEILAALPDNPAKTELQERAGALLDQIRQRAPNEKIAGLASQLSRQITRTYAVVTAPAKAPDPSGARQLFQAQCASCHGETGLGNGPLAQGMQPPPINFHDRERQFERSLFSLFNTLSQGVEGTAMRGYDELSQVQRWALAFYLGNMPFTDEERRAGEKVWQRIGINDLQTLTRLTPREAEQEYGPDGLNALAYLRSNPSVLDDPTDSDSALLQAQNKLDSSLGLYRDGQVKQAYSAALSAYLDGFELAESSVAAVDRELKNTIEARMLDYRQFIKQGAPLDKISAEHTEISQLLDRAIAGLEETTLSPSVGFAGSLAILLREGLEAILVLAAIAAVLIRSGRRDALRYLHFGWIAALLLGVATWSVSAYLLQISGAGRELTEGVTALLATAVLLYVGFWLHGKTHAQRWRDFVQDKLQKAMQGPRGLWLLAGVAFLAVYREVFETVLFYQALWLQASKETEPYLWLGIATAAAGLLLLGWLFLRTSLRLPLKTFFAINAGIMLVLAVTFAGHGIAALQEAGVLPIDKVPFLRLELLGIYPTAETLMMQFAVLLLIVAVFWYERRSRQRLISNQE